MERFNKFYSQRRRKCASKSTTHTCNRYCENLEYESPFPQRKRFFKKDYYWYCSFNKKPIPQWYGPNDKSYIQKFWTSRPMKKFTIRWPIILPYNYFPNPKILVTGDIKFFMNHYFIKIKAKVNSFIKKLKNCQNCSKMKNKFTFKCPFTHFEKRPPNKPLDHRDPEH